MHFLRSLAPEKQKGGYVCLMFDVLVSFGLKCFGAVTGGLEWWRTGLGCDLTA